MTDVSVMLESMAKNSDKKRPGRPAGRKPTATIYARIDPELARIFAAYVESLRPRTTTTAVVAMLIEEHMRSEELWPPSDQGSS